MHSIEAAIPYPQPPLTGEVFVLRPFQADDYEAARRLEQDPAAARWVPALPAADGVELAGFYDECRRDGSLLHLVIADRTSDEYLGEVMLALSEHRVGEVGCCVVPAARGRRVATDALVSLTEWSFATLDLGRVQVFVAPENEPALRLAASAGFRREGVLRSYWEIDGERIDAVILSRIRTADV